MRRRGHTAATKYCTTSSHYTDVTGGRAGGSHDTAIRMTINSYTDALLIRLEAMRNCLRQGGHVFVAVCMQNIFKKLRTDFGDLSKEECLCAGDKSVSFWTGSGILS